MMKGSSSSSSSSGGGGGGVKSVQQPDFDEEGRKLQATFNLPQTGGKWNNLDPIWKHPTGNGIIYVGNKTAAEDLNMLKKHNISRVVNCTDNIPNFHEKGGRIQYFTFNISFWQQFTNSTDASIIKFSKPLFDFIDKGIESGESVLVHCLAGAHRAGTTGCACLVHYANFDVDTAISAAKSLRDIINPIGHLPDFLRRLYAAEKRLAEAPSSSAAASSLSATAAFLQNSRLSMKQQSDSSVPDSSAVSSSNSSSSTSNISCRSYRDI